jgi:hypothetical protein
VAGSGFFLLVGPSASAAPAGWKSVQYGPVSVTVPASWPVINLTGTNQCLLLNQNAVYIGSQSADASCPARAVGKTGSVQIQPLSSASVAYRATTPATVNGQSARVDSASPTTQTMQTALPQANALVSVSWGDSGSATDQGTANQIEGSITASSGALQPTATTSSDRTDVPTSTARLTSYSGGLLHPQEQSSLSVGYGFDTCSAPSLGQMQAWLGSPYRTVGVYLGGANAACSQPNLTASWITTVENEGWSIIPIYVGLQAPCVTQGGLAPIVSSSASVEGAQAAADAVTDAEGVGLPQGTPIFFDMEAYGTGCSAAVTTFLTAWNAQLSALGYGSGVYESTSNIGDLVNVPSAQPNILWFAQWDDIATTSNSLVPSNLWAGNQRIKQYEGGHVETYGGVSIDIDSDYVDAVLAGPNTPAQRPTIATPNTWPSSSAFYQPGANQVQVYGATIGGSVYEKFYSYGSGAWSGWLDLGGLASESPVAFYQPKANDVLVYVVGPGNAVYEDAYSYGSGAWSGWVDLGGQIIGSPVAFYQPGTNQVQVYVVGPGNAVYEDFYNYGAGAWSGWLDLGGQASASPVAFYLSAANQVQVYVVGPGNAVYEAFYNYGAGAWSGWLYLGGQASASPVAFYQPGANQVQVYVVGPGSSVYEAFYSYGAGAWSGWLDLGGQASGSPVAIYQPGANQVQVYVVGPGSSVYEAFYSYSAGAWNGWVDLGGQISGDPVAFYQPETNQVEVYAVGIDGSVYEAIDSASGWIDLGGSVSGFST